MNGVDPKIGIALNIAYTVCGLIAAGTIVFVGIPDNVVTIIKTTALDASIILGVVNMALGLWSSNRPGPMVNLPTIPPNVTKILLVTLLPLALLAMSGSAYAQVKLVKPTGNIVEDIKSATAPPQKLITGNIERDAHAIWDKLVAASQTDLKYASALAAAANTPASAVRKQCYDAIIVLNIQVNGMNVKDANGNVLPQPDPKLFTGVEQAAETIDNLSPSGPLFTSCAGMAQLTKTNVLTLINAIVTGAAAFAIMPVIPGL